MTNFDELVPGTLLTGPLLPEPIEASSSSRSRTA